MSATSNSTFGTANIASANAIINRASAWSKILVFIARESVRCIMDWVNPFADVKVVFLVAITIPGVNPETRNKSVTAS